MASKEIIVNDRTFIAKRTVHRTTIREVGKKGVFLWHKNKRKNIDNFKFSEDRIREKIVKIEIPQPAPPAPGIKKIYRVALVFSNANIDYWNEYKVWIHLFFLQKIDKDGKIFLKKEREEAYKSEEETADEWYEKAKIKIEELKMLYPLGKMRNIPVDRMGELQEIKFEFEEIEEDEVVPKEFDEWLGFVNFYSGHEYWAKGNPLRQSPPFKIPQHLREVFLTSMM